MKKVRGWEPIYERLGNRRAKKFCFFTYTTASRYLLISTFISENSLSSYLFSLTLIIFRTQSLNPILNLYINIIKILYLLSSFRIKFSRNISWENSRFIWVPGRRYSFGYFSIYLLNRFSGFYSIDDFMYFFL